jgi:RNA polymerase subunit RPABC4/transcription elongation factor Spt4
MTCRDCQRVVLTRKGTRCPERRAAHRRDYMRARRLAQLAGQGRIRQCACGVVLDRRKTVCEACRVAALTAHWRATAAERRKRTIAAQREEIRAGGVGRVPGDLTAREIEARLAQLRDLRRRQRRAA